MVSFSTSVVENLSMYFWRTSFAMRPYGSRFYSKEASINIRGFCGLNAIYPRLSFSFGR